jgi:hypothetical protein
VKNQKNKNMEIQTKHLKFKTSYIANLYTKLQTPTIRESFGLSNADHGFELQMLQFKRPVQRAA